MPKRAIVSRMVTNLLGVTSEDAAAHRYLNVLLSLEPAHGQFHFLRAMVHYRLGDYPASREDVTWLLEHRHDGDAYDKSFKSWDHLVALIYAQLSGNDSLRGVVAGFNANPHHHYHLGTGQLSRSTLSDANTRRPDDRSARRRRGWGG